MSFKSLLNQKCDIERKSTSRDGRGNTVSVWSASSNNVPCRINMQTITTPEYGQTGSGLSAENSFIGFFEKDANILVGDRVLWSGTELFVKGVPPVYDSMNLHHIEVLLGLQET